MDQNEQKAKQSFPAQNNNLPTGEKTKQQEKTTTNWCPGVKENERKQLPGN